MKKNILKYEIYTSNGLVKSNYAMASLYNKIWFTDRVLAMKERLKVWQNK